MSDRKTHTPVPEELDIFLVFTRTRVKALFEVNYLAGVLDGLLSYVRGYIIIKKLRSNGQ